MLPKLPNVIHIFTENHFLYILESITISFGENHITVGKVLYDLYYINLMHFSHSNDKANKWSMHPAKTHLSLGVCSVWPVFAVCMRKAGVFSCSLSAQRIHWPVIAGFPSLICHAAAYFFSVGIVQQSIVIAGFWLGFIARPSCKHDSKPFVILSTIYKYYSAIKIRVLGMSICLYQ